MSNIPVFDGHNDTLLNLWNLESGQGRSFFERSEIGHIDLPRAKEANFAGGFFAVFVPPTAEQWQGLRAWRAANPDAFPPLASAVPFSHAHTFAMMLSAMLFRLEKASNGAFKVMRTIDELEATIGSDVMAAILHFEGAEPIDEKLDSLEIFYQAGLRSLGLVWSRPNAFATGVPFKFPSSPDIGPGLTDAGKALVKACNELGILIDLSHLNEKGFWDVEKLSDAPLVATHSNAHAITPLTRNLTDQQMDAIKATGGVAGLNFGTIFLSPEGKSNTDVGLDVMIQHVDYMVERMGIDHVAFGSDFDGTSVPDAIGDVTGLPNLLTALRAAGYDDEALAKLAYKNWLRVLRLTWK